MSQNKIMLTDEQMANFTAKGYLVLDSVIPEEINKQFLNDIGHTTNEPVDSVHDHYARIMQKSTIPIVKAGTPLHKSYSKGSALDKIIDNPTVSGAIDSLVGLDCVLDHHFLHITFPSKYYEGSKRRKMSQGNHQDSTININKSFDIQLFYFPHEVTKEMGGTRYIPGSHFRVVSEHAIARYQNIKGQKHVVCPAGTIIIMHMNIWHGAGVNNSNQIRYAFKIRLMPTKKQELLWTDKILYDDQKNDAIYWTDGNRKLNNIGTILNQTEPWFENDSGRLDIINRIKFWRYISGDNNFDTKYWLTRLENDFQ